VSTPAAVSAVVQRKAHGSKGVRLERTSSESAAGRAKEAKVVGCCEPEGCPGEGGKGDEPVTPNGETSSHVFGAPAIAGSIYPFTC